MLEIFFDAIYGQNFFDKDSPGDYFGPFGYASCIAIRGINLSDSARISVAGRPDEKQGMEIAEIKFSQSVGVVRHGFSVDEKRRSFK